MARSLTISLPATVTAVLKNVDDDIVALVALDLEQEQLLEAVDSKLWRSRVCKDNLYSDHWLLAYEAYAQGWLPSVDGSRLEDDPFFSILLNEDVKFYDTGVTWEEGYSDYTDGDDEDDEDGEEEIPAAGEAALGPLLRPF